jgi:hypothetical protein
MAAAHTPISGQPRGWLRGSAHGPRRALEAELGCAHRRRIHVA